MRGTTPLHDERGVPSWTDDPTSGSPAWLTRLLRIGLCLVVIAGPGAVTAGASATGSGPSAGGLSGSGPSDGRIAVVVVFEDEDRVSRTPIEAANGTVTGGTDVSLLPVLFARIEPGAIETVEARAGVRRVFRDTSLDRSEPRASVQPEARTTSQAVPWGVSRIDARAADAAVSAEAASNVTVAVLDTGIDHDHEDLASSVAWGVDTSGSGAPVVGIEAADDPFGHGTHVAGTVAAEDNGEGVVGVAPDVRLYAIKVFGEGYSASISDLVEGLDAAVAGPDGAVGTEDDADVISMSLGGDAPSELEREAIERASDHAVLVAGVGNDGDGDPDTVEVEYPARYEAVIGVGAIDQQGRPATFSGEGPAVEVAAPGTAVLSTYPDDRYRRLSGTSMAVPHVSGSVALAIARDRAHGATEGPDGTIRERLRETAVDVDPAGVDRFTGYGVVRASKVVGPREVDLAIETNRTTVAPGDAVAFLVTRADTGVTVDATVSVDGTTYRSGSDGRVVHEARAVGTVTAVATKPATGTETFRDAETTVIVSPGDLTGDGRLARDLDGDGDYEDANGDGAFTIVDLQALFVHRHGSVVEDHPGAFDFNGDGTVTVVDLQALFVALR